MSNLSIPPPPPPPPQPARKGSSVGGIILSGVTIVFAILGTFFAFTGIVNFVEYDPNRESGGSVWGKDLDLFIAKVQLVIAGVFFLIAFVTHSFRRK